MPEHLTSKTNNVGHTATQIFIMSHEGLVKESSDWLKETSNSCSEVAALIVGMSFAMSSSVPGRTTRGKLDLQGECDSPDIPERMGYDETEWVTFWEDFRKCASEDKCGAAGMSDVRGVTNGIRVGPLTQYGVVRGRTKQKLVGL
ncbi:hypothetical protein Fmac_026998 [Flemingia macrophylla]|uniref:Uncharacterized protein n=1 Tax=Flemingia macrophylla TaxID=520843 RepID=A0ABD1LGG8_9FABA